MRKILSISSALIILFFSFAFRAEASDPKENTYPTPERLFHISRSANKNLVCYDINLKNGKLDTHNPLHVYWVNREEHPGKTDELSYFQKKMAYGYKLVSEGNDSSVITLTAYPAKQLTIRKLENNYICSVTINNRPSILRSLYVKANPKNPLSVEYVELQGVTLDTNETISETIYK